MKTIEQNILEAIKPITTQKILLAFSGGVDSVVLAHVLSKNGYSITLAHCNFQLRGKESDQDEQFCKDFANKYSCEIFIKKFDTTEYADKQKKNIQLSARELRYTWFNELCDLYSIKYLATAHHLNDSLETFIINLSRGTGLKGLLGITEKKNLIRPLLSITKEEIYAYARENSLEWREDSSNQKTTYLRNKIRQNISPELEKLHPQFMLNFKKTLGILDETYLFLQDSLQSIIKECTVDKNTYDCKVIKQQRYISLLLHTLFSPFGFINLVDLTSILEAETGKYLENEQYKLIKDRSYLRILPKTIKSETIRYVNKIKNELRITDYIKTIDFSNKIFTNTSIEIPENLLILPMSIRSWSTDDIFQPLGMKGKKKVSKFLKDSKIPLHLREQILVLCNGNNEIIWVIGLRMNEKYKKNNTLLIQITIE